MYFVVPILSISSLIFKFLKKIEFEVNLKQNEKQIVTVKLQNNKI
jgi:hypothetical protein